ncbi:glycosyltransferase family 4 protein [uncultured Aquimarina sp.]|uniref:glycosyltransferase family 4 protein n=1 Tax=uncultured Aquimarina sp. TaxID=575652 RepID=UPI0026301AAC|nr:glycosyltransferase family 4 protein [uncultured Aquimarina sp.]
MKKKLLFITPLFPKNKDDDTIVPFIYQFCNYLDTNFDDLQIDIIALRYPDKKKEYSINSLKIYPVGGGFKTKWNSVLVISKALIKGIKLFGRTDYDGILSFWYSDTAIVGNLLKLIFRVKHFTWLQGQDVKSNNKYLRLFRPTEDQLIVVGKNHQEVLKKHWGMTVKKIANVAVDTNTFPELNIEQRPIDIIGVGNLGALKNYSLFIEIILELKKVFKNINVIICGDGEEKEMLNTKIDSLGLRGNITLMGYVPNKKVRELLNDSKILLHTSQFEGNSMVVQEALYSGCKVISTFPLLERITNFFFEDNKASLIKQSTTLLSKNHEAKRVRHFKIEETADVIYSCFFDSK